MASAHEPVNSPTEARWWIFPSLPTTLERRSSSFAVARSSLADVKMAWPLAALDEIEDLLGAYVGRGSRYAPAKLSAPTIPFAANQPMCFTNFFK